MDVLGIGAPIVDHVLYVSEEHLASLPGKKGGMEIVDERTFSMLLYQSNAQSQLVPGGSSANTIRGLAHLGRKCGMIGKIGTDEIGKKFLHSLHVLDIEAFLLKSQTPTAQVISFVTPDGERTLRAYLGACLEMTMDDLNQAHFQNVKIVHIEGYTLNYPGITERSMEYAKQAGALVSFDLASFETVHTHKQKILDLLLRYVDICFCNADECEALLGYSNINQGCAQLKELCSLAIVHYGKAGCWIGHKEEIIHCPAYPIDNPLDTTAAGDLFASGFLHGYLSKKPLAICADYGALLGAEAVQVQGSSLTSDQWQRLKEHIGYETSQSKDISR